MADSSPFREEVPQSDDDLTEPVGDEGAPAPRVRKKRKKRRNLSLYRTRPKARRKRPRSPDLQGEGSVGFPIEALGFRPTKKPKEGHETALEAVKQQLLPKLESANTHDHARSPSPLSARSTLTDSSDVDLQQSSPLNESFDSVNMPSPHSPPASTFSADGGGDFQPPSPGNEQAGNDALGPKYKGLVEKLVTILPYVLKKLEGAGVLHEFVTFFHLVEDDAYPLQNVAFLLWLETVRWHHVPTSTEMHYWEHTLKFWDTGYSLFHGKFLRLLSGPKHLGQVVSGEASRGYYRPSQGEVNFAVPDVSVIRKYSTGAGVTSRTVDPGVIEEALDVVATAKKGIPQVLSIDGKKVASGLTADAGDVNLFGFEEGVTLSERQARLKEEEEEIASLSSVIERYGAIEAVPTPVPVVERLKNTISILSHRIKDLRELKVKQEMGLNKFKALGGDEWRSSKYVFAISSIQCHLFRINSAIEQALQCIFRLCSIGCAQLGSSDVLKDGHSIDLHLQKNFIQLKDPDQLPATHVGLPEFTKQRTDEWFGIRREVPVTGSTLHNAVGLGSLSEMRAHFDEKIRKIEPPARSPDVIKFMEHGTVNEVNALSTLASQVLPMFYPGYSYCEEGVYPISSAGSGKPSIAVSPDGSLRHAGRFDFTIGPPDIGVEVKCPYPNEFKPPVHYAMPERYVPQVLAEMKALGAKKLVYLSYSKQSSTVFEVAFDQEMWALLEKEVEDVYLPDCPRRPSTVSAEMKAMKKEGVKLFLKNNVRFLAEVPSVVASGTGSTTLTIQDSPHMFPINYQEDDHGCQVPTDVRFTLQEATRILQDSYQICRQKGTEVLVFMLSDINRSWHKEVPHSVPVAYGLKGYSLSTGHVRKMIEKVLDACHERGIHVPCTSFDGQWAPVMTKDLQGQPLTRLQMQKTIWDQAKATSKAAIVSYLKKLGVVDSAKDIENQVQFDWIEGRSRGYFLSSTEDIGRLKTPSQRDLWIGKAKAHKDVAPVDANHVDSLPDDVLDQRETLAVVVDAISSPVEPELDADFELDADELPDLPAVVVTPSSSLSTAGDRTSSVNLSDKYCSDILQEWKRLETGKQKKKWEDAQPSDVPRQFENAKSLKKLNIPELDVALTCTTALHKQTYKKSWPKPEKVNFLSELFGDSSRIEQEKKIKPGEVQTLRSLAGSSLANRKYPKAVLNSIYATAICTERYADWDEHGQFNIEGIDRELRWHYKPDYSSSRDQHEVKVLDGHHLLVNLRVKVCKDGLRGYGVRKEAWHAVAEKSPHILSKALVSDLIDKQSGAYARRTFSLEVEEEMIALEYEHEAHFVRLIRNWWEAEDKPGIGALDRALRRLNLRDFLLAPVDFTSFPPPGMFVQGMSATMFEGFLCSIDAHFMLYELCKMPYNQRAIGSQDCEGFFSELTDMEPTKLGCPKAVNVGRLMSTATKLLHYRCDPKSRIFSLWTTRNATYPVKPALEVDTSEMEHDADTGASKKFSNLSLRDHFFDTRERARTKGRAKKSDVSKPDAPSRGVHGVRQHHRRDESKIAPTTRMGIDMTD